MIPRRIVYRRRRKRSVDRAEMVQNRSFFFFPFSFLFLFRLSHRRFDTPSVCCVSRYTRVSLFVRSYRSIRNDAISSRDELSWKLQKSRYPTSKHFFFFFRNTRKKWFVQDRYRSAIYRAACSRHVYRTNNESARRDGE